MRLAVCLLVPLCCLAVPAASEEPPAGIPADDLGLAPGSVFEVLVPEAVERNLGDPGDRPSLPRAFEGAPPLVPHGMGDYLPITREDNLCVDCHAITEAEEGDPTPLPASHYTDLRRTPGELGEVVVGARWVCVSCHVPPTGAEPLVGSRFAERAEPPEPAAAAPPEAGR